MLFVLAVGAFSVGAVAALAAIAFRFPVFWAVVLSLVCFAWARHGFTALGGTMNPAFNKVMRNSTAAFGLAYLVGFSGVLAFALSPLPHTISRWWLLAVPLWPFAVVGIQGLLEAILDRLNRSGRREAAYKTS